MRVVAGRLGGRRLTAPPGEATRPTSDRVREAVFSILRDVQGANVADLYAGSGALGLEALSRGAGRAVFVESASRALAALRANLEALGVGECTAVVVSDLARAGPSLAAHAPFDLVFVDPPYELVRRGAAPRAVDRVLSPSTLAPEARLVFEHASVDPPPTLSVATLVDSRRYGNTTVSFYEVAPPS